MELIILINIYKQTKGEGKKNYSRYSDAKISI